LPRHKSCKKRMKTAVIANERNRAERSKVKKMIKDLRASKTKAEADGLLTNVFSSIDKAAHKHRMHKNKAARDKSRLMKFVKNLEPQKTSA
jgi:small subunit ribosomal protein S20